MIEGAVCKAHLSSLKRGLAALGLLNLCGTLTASRLAIDLQLPRTTARRILDTLAAEGYVEKSAPENEYRITPLVQVLAGAWFDARSIARVALPRLARGALELGWPLYVVIWSRLGPTVEVSTDSWQPLPFERWHVGRRLPAPSGAAAQTLLAFTSPRRRGLMLRSLGLAAGSDPLSPADAHTAPVAVETVRDRGYAESVDGEGRVGSIVVPLLQEQIAYAGLEMRYSVTAIEPARVHSTVVPRLQAVAGAIGEALRSFSSGDPDEHLSHSGVPGT